MVSFRVSEDTQENIINNFDDFFQIVQEKTDFFRYKKDGQLIPYNLFEQQKRWLSLFDEDKPQRRALLASRDKGKSEIVTILGSSWQLYQNPKVRIGIMSFKYENAEKFVHQILQVLKSLNQELIHRSGGWYTQESDRHTPSLMPLGLMSTVRGMHFDFLIMDDPLTINEQFSKKYIEKSRYFLNEGASLAEKIILIGQLLTRNDIYYDAYGDSTERYYVLQSWHSDIPALDKDINYLTSTIGKKDVARNYLGYIDDEDEAIFQSIQFIDAKPEGEVFAFIDPSAKGKDYTAVCLGWIKDASIVIYGKLFKENWGLCLEKIIAFTRESKIVYFEDNQGTALGVLLRKSGIPAMGVCTTSNKIAKIYSLRGLVLSERLKLCKTMDSESIMQIKNWTETAEYDDLPDCMAMLVQRMGWIYIK